MFWTIIAILEFILIGKLLYDHYLGSSIQTVALTLIQNDDGTFTVEGNATYPIIDGKLHVKVDMDQQKSSQSSTGMIALKLCAKATLLGKTALGASSLPTNMVIIANDLLDDIPLLINSIMPNPLPVESVNSLAMLPPPTTIQALTDKE